MASPYASGFGRGSRPGRRAANLHAATASGTPPVLPEMPADLDAPAAPDVVLDAATLDALRRLALECAEATDEDAVLAAVRGGVRRITGAEVVVIGPGDEGPADGLLVRLGRQASGAHGLLTASGDGMLRAVAAPMRVHGEPAGLALGWSGDDPGPERAAALAAALAGQTAVALGVVARYQGLRDAAFRRDRFFSAMSHDLRTPITAIVGYSELLHDGIVGQLTARQQEMVERICQVSNELSQLVTDMLDLAKLDAGRMEFHREPISLQELVDSALEAVEVQLETSGGTVARRSRPGDDAVLVVDRPRVRQVLANMISHAAHAAPGGSVELAAGSDGADAVVEVADQGPALEAAGEESLFAAAPRAAARAGPGAALSLALSRRIARAMGGEVEARSRPGGGVVLTLRLPRG